jgi:hypothetical protein
MIPDPLRLSDEDTTLGLMHRRATVRSARFAPRIHHTAIFRDHTLD